MALRGLTGRGEGEPRHSGGWSGGPEATFIDSSAELIGELRFKDSVRIEGRVEGEIHASKVVVVGESATIAAGIEAESVVVHGIVEGDIRVTHELTLHKTARVTGQIQTAGIVVEPGARFKGTIIIGDDEPKAPPSPLQPPLPGGAAGGSSSG